MTGISPFHGLTSQEVLVKNKEGVINISEPQWINVSADAKDLVLKLTCIDPALRYSASQALQHPWFKMEHTENIMLSSAYENMQKHDSKHRFNIEKIKPQFGIATGTPLFISGSGSTTPGGVSDSPMVSSPDFQSDVVKEPKNFEDAKKQAIKMVKNKRENKRFMKLSSFHTENERKKELEREKEHENYNEKEMSENETGISQKQSSSNEEDKNGSILGNHKIPATPGFKPQTTFMRMQAFGTPVHVWAVNRIDRAKLEPKKEKTLFASREKPHSESKLENSIDKKLAESNVSKEEKK